MNNFLKYGDLVIFYLSPQSQARKANELPSIGTYGGILASPGFADTALYMQEVPKPVGEEIVHLEADLNLLGLREAVFTITPKLNYDFHKDYKKTLSYFKSLEASLRNARQEDKSQYEMLRDNLRAKLIKLEERTKKEEQLNLSIIRENTGKTIHFGAEVQVMHYDSGCFIRATNDCSQTKTIGYICELSNFFSLSMVFKIFPRYRSRQDGDAIQLRDNIIFQNMKHKAFLTISPELPLHDSRISPGDVNPFLTNCSTHDPRVKRSRVFLSQEKEAYFQIVLYRNQHVDGHLYLLGGDIVKITHTELQADLSASITHIKGNQPEVYLRNYEGEYREEATSISSYWIVEHLEFEKAGERFKVAEMRPPNGGPKLASKVRLRHLVTGLNVQNAMLSPADNELTLHLLTDLSQPDEFCAFDLEPVVKNSQYLLNNQIYFITENEGGCYLKQDRMLKYERNNEELMEELKKNDPNYLFYPLESGDIGEIKHAVRLNIDLSSEDAFVIQKINEVEKREILFVKSVMPKFKYLLEIFTHKKIEEEDTDFFNEVIKVLQAVIAFLFDLDATQDIEYFDIEGLPSPRKQKLLKDLGFIDALIHVIYMPFRNGLYNFKLITKSDSFGKMLEMTYTSVRYAIKEYRQNELYASQWLHLIMEQSVDTSGNNDVRAGQTLTELIDNNQRILESRIELSTIQRFVKILSQKDKDAKYIDILRAICICDGRPIIKNQKDITREMLQEPENKKKLVFDVNYDSMSGIILGLHIPGYDEVALANLEAESKERDAGKTFGYVISMIRLLSDLCKDRNYLTIDNMQKNFTYEICYEVVSNKRYEFKIREAFASFMINLWVDVSPLQKVQLPNCVKMWDRSGDYTKSRLRDQQFVNKHEKLKGFLFEYLNDLGVSSKTMMNLNSDKIEDKCAFDLSILELTE